MENEDFCDECGNTDLDSCHIAEWQQMFKDRYGYDYLKGKNYFNYI